MSVRVVWATVLVSARRLLAAIAVSVGLLLTPSGAFAQAARDLCNFTTEQWPIFAGCDLVPSPDGESYFWLYLGEGYQRAGPQRGPEMLLSAMTSLLTNAVRDEIDATAVVNETSQMDCLTLTTEGVLRSLTRASLAGVDVNTLLVEALAVRPCPTRCGPFECLASGQARSRTQPGP